MMMMMIYNYVNQSLCVYVPEKSRPLAKKALKAKEATKDRAIEENGAYLARRQRKRR